MSTSTESKRRDTKNSVRLVVFAIAVVLLVWFVIGNAHSVKVQFWVTSAQTSLIAVIPVLSWLVPPLIAVILLSAALGALISLVMVRRKR